MDRSTLKKLIKFLNKECLGKRLAIRKALKSLRYHLENLADGSQRSSLRDFYREFKRIFFELENQRAVSMHCQWVRSDWGDDHIEEKQPVLRVAEHAHSVEMYLIPKKHCEKIESILDNLSAQYQDRLSFFLPAVAVNLYLEATVHANGLLIHFCSLQKSSSRVQ